VRELSWSLCDVLEVDVLLLLLLRLLLLLLHIS
jgi:hypothetical protein